MSELMLMVIFSPHLRRRLNRSTGPSDRGRSVVHSTIAVSTTALCRVVDRISRPWP
jgi:hypothetical protein